MTAILVTRPVVQVPAAGAVQAGTQPAAADSSTASIPAPAPPSVDPPTGQTETEPSDNPVPVASSPPATPRGWIEPSSDQRDVGDGASSRDFSSGSDG